MKYFSILFFVNFLVILSAKPLENPLESNEVIKVKLYTNHMTESPVAIGLLTKIFGNFNYKNLRSIQQEAYLQNIV